VSRPYLLAYNLTTGVMISSFTPTPNAQVRSISIAPDGSRIYVGGNFTTINGVTHNRIAALDPTTGAPISSFTAGTNGDVTAVDIAGSSLYVGGSFTAANASGGKSVARGRSAAFATGTGALLPWAPNAIDGYVRAIVVSPDVSQVVLGGSFTTMNGSSDPGYGLADVDATTGALLPFAVNDALVRDAGANASIMSLYTDGDSVYGTGYVASAQGGNLEGTFRASWNGGAVSWIESCHGDTYSVAELNNVIYTASHAHYCGDIGGFPQTNPWHLQHALAFSKAATTTTTADPYGYYNYAGVPAPSILAWYPDFTDGSYTSAGQAAWNIATSGNYVLYGGEFPSVNSTAQQGLVRFAVSSVAPNKQGPRNSGPNFLPSVASLASGTARVSWTSNWDRDNENLTYQVYRNDNLTTPVYTTTGPSDGWWNQPQLGFTDTGLTPGATYKYRVRATDPSGNTALGSDVSVTVSSSGSLSQYSKDVLNAGASDYWRLDEAAGSSKVYDWAGFQDATASSGVTLGAAGATGDGDTSASFSGDSTGLVATTAAIQGPQVFSISAWFKTTSTAGGKIVGFGDTNTGNSSNYDRHIYMDGSGRVYFGVYPGFSATVQSGAGLNDGNWHQVVGSLSSSGMQLFIDGKQVAQRSDVTSAQSYSGYWRIGGDTSWSGANYFAGSIDDVAVYPGPLSLSTVHQQYVDAGYGTPLQTAPTDAYGAAVYSGSPEFYWRLNDTNGSVAKDSSPVGAEPGVVSGGVTEGVSGALSTAGNTADSFDGNTGLIVDSQQVSDPETYSEELWFNSTTTSGGKLIGFGNAQSGTSSSYDRHIYLQNSGQLEFGTWTGQENTIVSPQSYNDGAWHYVVATQSNQGLALYVDGQLVGTNPTTQAQAYDGYWRVGGDTTWEGSSSSFVNAKIDEVAVYPTALTPAVIAQHYALGTNNSAPSASFTSSSSFLSASFDGSGSKDSDGTISSYSWNFGDSSALGSGVTATHTYAAAGTYAVTLTVTDNGGLSTSTTKQVTVTAPNVPPVAQFTATNVNLTATLDGSTSTDPDGNIAAYSWDFGDSTATGSGVSVNHTYATAGTYTVTLSVTDNSGATTTITHPVTVTAANVPPVAAFTSSVSNLTANFDGTGSSDSDGTIAGYSWNFGDQSASSTSATPTHVYATAGTYTVTLTVTDNSGATTSVSHPVVVSAANVAPTAAFSSSTSNLLATLDASGSSDPDGTISSYSWNFGDSSAAGSGKSTTHTYASAGTYSVTLTVTDNSGASTSITQPVTVATSPAPTVYASDAFGRTVAGGLGSADVGGPWTIVGSASNYSVNNGGANLLNSKVSVNDYGYLAGVSSSSTEMKATISTQQTPTGNGLFTSFLVRRVGSDDYRAQVILLPAGQVNLNVAHGTAPLKSIKVAGLTYTPGTQLNVRVQAYGTNATTIRAKVWLAGTTEPTAWQITSTDSTAALQAPGSVGIGAYLGGTSTTLPTTTTFSNLWVGSVVNP
jgi:PKD repeat protein